VTHHSKAPWPVSPAWAPDGRRIAFAAMKWDGGLPRAGRSAHIEVIDADGPLRQRLGTGLAPRWSPDGRQILFRKLRSGLYAMDANGRSERLLIPHAEEGVLVAGRQAHCLYLPPACGARQTAIDVWHLSGGGGRCEAAAPAAHRAREISGLQWLPDSQHLVFTQVTRETDGIPEDAAVCMMHADTGASASSQGYVWDDGGRLLWDLRALCAGVLYVQHDPLNERFLDALKSRQSAKARVLLAESADPNARLNYFGVPALTLAVGTNDLALVQAMVERGADVNARYPMGGTALEATGDVAMARLLLAKGARADTRRSGGAIPLMGAAEAGNIPLMKLFLEHGADVNARRGDGETVLDAWSDERLSAPGLDAGSPAPLASRREPEPRSRAAAGGERGGRECPVRRRLDASDACGVLRRRSGGEIPHGPWGQSQLVANREGETPRCWPALTVQMIMMVIFLTNHGAMIEGEGPLARDRTDEGRQSDYAPTVQATTGGGAR